MSEFVNYRKRGIQLPPGCKDLIDVLRRTAAVSEQPVVTRGSEILGKLSDVPRYVSMLVNSRSKQSTLLISTTDERLTLMLCRSVIEGISAGVMLTGDSKHEKGIREFFRRHGIEALQDELFPGELRGLMYPLPADASRASQIVTDLFRGVYGFTEASPIRFHYYDVAGAA